MISTRTKTATPHTHTLPFRIEKNMEAPKKSTHFQEERKTINE